MKKFKKIFLLYISAALALISCTKEEMSHPNGTNPSTKADHALVMYCAGFNNLSSDLQNNIETMKSGWIPEKDGRTMFFTLEHFPTKPGFYSDMNAPVLKRIWREGKKIVTKDVLHFPDRIIASDALTVGQVFHFLMSHYDIKSFGMIFSSHSTGYLPRGYYTNSSAMEGKFPDFFNAETAKLSYSKWREILAYDGLYPNLAIENQDIPTKSMGSDFIKELDGLKLYKEMEIYDFARAIPVKLDYLLMDTCLMGGIEVAWEFKDICNCVGFSQTEVLTAGIDYSHVGQYLLLEQPSNVISIGEDYIKYYMQQDGDYQSATWSTIDCSKLEPLADVCTELFEKYRDNLNNMSEYNIQRYYRFDYHWFYDLRSIIRNAGANEEELNRLDQALDACVIYKGATPKFLGININEHSGLSMMLPSYAGEYLTSKYHLLRWNQKTHLVD